MKCTIHPPSAPTRIIDVHHRTPPTTPPLPGLLNCAMRPPLSEAAVAPSRRRNFQPRQSRCSSIKSIARVMVQKMRTWGRRGGGAGRHGTEDVAANEHSTSGGGGGG